jgi:hypothetical protein
MSGNSSTTPTLAHSTLTDKVWIVTRYTITADGQMIAHTKIDVTAEFDRIAAGRGWTRLPTIRTGEEVSTDG